MIDDDIQLAESPREAEGGIRNQIMVAANAHFSRYGFAKTTMTDLAKEIGFSKAYLYRFFDSKQAIGEAICSQTLGGILEDVMRVSATGSAMERLRALFRRLPELEAELFFEDRKLYDIVACSAAEKWPSSVAYCDRIVDLTRDIIIQGRESGEFERKTPLDETCRAIVQTMQPFVNPLMLQYNLDLLPTAPQEVTSLILRSLAP